MRPKNVVLQSTYPILQNIDRHTRNTSTTARRRTIGNDLTSFYHSFHTLKTIAVITMIMATITGYVHLLYTKLYTIISDLLARYFIIKAPICNDCSWKTYWLDISFSCSVGLYWLRWLERRESPGLWMKFFFFITRRRLLFCCIWFRFLYFLLRWIGGSFIFIVELYSLVFWDWKCRKYLDSLRLYNLPSLYRLLCSSVR